jgi:hypothetical protein
MIICSKCSNWFHFSCVGIESMKEAKKLKEFHCKSCLGELTLSIPNKKSKPTSDEQEPYTCEDFEYFTSKLLGEIESIPSVIGELNSQFSTLLNIQKLLKMEEDSTFQELRILIKEIL